MKKVCVSHLVVVNGHLEHALWDGWNIQENMRFILSILQYENEEQATATRAALHGTTWPQSNPKILKVEYASKDEVINYPLLITLCACSNKKTFFSVKTLTTFLMF